MAGKKWLTENEIEDDNQTVLETIFGYLYLDTVEHPEEELQRKIDESTAVLDSELRSVAEFYTMFHDVYNAVKHRNRAIPQTQNELQFVPDKNDGDALNFPFEEANELLDVVAIVDEVMVDGMREHVRL